MKKILLLLFAPFIFPLAGIAGLGDAQKLSVRVFDAWCGVRHNKCKVEFTNDSMTVNHTDGINRSQMLSYSYDKFWEKTPCFSACRNHQFTISFKENNEIQKGTFIFVNDITATNFRQALDAFCYDENCGKVYGESGPGRTN